MTFNYLQVKCIRLLLLLAFIGFVVACVFFGAFTSRANALNPCNATALKLMRNGTDVDCVTPTLNALTAFSLAFIVFSGLLILCSCEMRRHENLSEYTKPNTKAQVQPKPANSAAKKIEPKPAAKKPAASNEPKPGPSAAVAVENELHTKNKKLVSENVKLKKEIDEIKKEMARLLPPQNLYPPVNQHAFNIASNSTMPMAPPPPYTEYQNSGFANDEKC